MVSNKSESVHDSKSSAKSKTASHRQSKKTLNLFETKDRSIAENIRDGYFETDLAGIITFVNQVMCEIYGYAEEELLGMNSRQFTDKETAKRLFRLFNEVFKTGKKADIVDFEITRKDGTKRQVEVSATLKKDSSGKAMGYAGISRDITERKRMEEAIRLSEERFRGAIEQMQDAYYEIDLVGNYIYVNDALCRFYELPKEQIFGSRLGLQRQDETNARKTRNAFNEVFRTGKPVEALEVEYIQPDGKSIGNYELSITLIRDAHGYPVGFRGITKNITERKRMEEQLRKSEERYRTILDDIDEGYYEEDLAGTLTFVNDALARNLGYSKEEMIGMNYRLWCDDQTAAKMQELFSRVYVKGEPVKDVESVFIAKNGAKRIAEFTGALIRDKEGRPSGFRGISRDITLWKKEEESRRLEAERYRIMLEDIKESYFELDMEGRFTFVNDAQCRDLGYTREELLGTCANSYTDETMKQKTKDVFEHICKTRQSAGYEADYVAKDGTRYCSEVFVSLMIDSQGIPTGFRGLSRNISERKRAEQERENLISELQRALSEVKTLSGLLPICASCKKIRNDKGYWEQIEKYIGERSKAAFSHSICPDCARKLYPDFYDGK